MSEGVFTLLGVLVGAALTWLINMFHHRNQRRERAAYCALRAVIALDAYVARTASHLPPDDSEQDYGLSEEFTNPSSISLPEDVDWSSIDANTAYRILSVPGRHSQAAGAVSYIRHIETVWSARAVRDELFAKLALDCVAISKSLRKHYNLPAAVPSDLNKDWNPEKVLRKLLPHEGENK
ncbi:MAG: hypothetical protein RLO80_01055 [Hyphomonas sp.]